MTDHTTKLQEQVQSTLAELKQLAGPRKLQALFAPILQMQALNRRLVDQLARVVLWFEEMKLTEEPIAEDCRKVIEGWVNPSSS